MGQDRLILVYRLWKSQMYLNIFQVCLAFFFHKNRKKGRADLRMMNGLWAGMMLAGIIWAMFHGTLADVTDGAIQSAGEAVSLCITMLGVMSLWTGILEIGSRAGLIQQMCRKMRPVMRFLFPRLPENHPAANSIAVNMIANMLGMGWAATPAGLQAMKELEELEKTRRENSMKKAVPKGTASNEMCTFLIINISSLQLIPVTMIAYRAQYGSTDPAGVVGPALAATMISTAAGVIFCKIMDRNTG